MKRRNVMLTRRQVGAATLGAAAALGAPAIAGAQPSEAWPNPNRPVEVIVLANAGGPVDVMTRLILPFVAERIPGLRTVVTNRPGAGGQIGLEATFNAAPDGYTLGATTIPAQMAIPIERPTRYRAMDFTFIANIVEDPNAFYVHADSPFRSVADVIARARAAPGTISCATTGIGSDDHIFLLAFEAAARIPPLVHVPFTGNAPLFSQLLGGHLDLAAVNINDAIALMREGKVRALAMAGTERSRFAPEVPTMRELGFDIVTGASRGILGPPGMPAPIVAKLEEGFRGALSDPRFLAEAERQFMPLRPLVGADYRRMAQGVEEMVRALWQVRPWRDR
jgi:tripartite-type tricarboxylate transporter receptor subunit TctC